MECPDHSETRSNDMEVQVTNDSVKVIDSQDENTNNSVNVGHGDGDEVCSSSVDGNDMNGETYIEEYNQDDSYLYEKPEGDYEYDEYGNEWIENLNYGDGVDEITFENIKKSIHFLIKSTKTLMGKVSDEAEQYLVTTVAVCSPAQRNELMTVIKSTHGPLSLACSMGSLNLVRFFVENCDADVNEPLGWPLYWAVRTENVELVKYLLEKGADVSICFYGRINVLMTALDIIDQELIFLLQKAHNFHNQRKKVLIKTNASERPIQPNNEIVNLLLEHEAIEKSDKETLHLYLEKILVTVNGEYEKNSCIENLLERIEDVCEIHNEDGVNIAGWAMCHLFEHVRQNTEFVAPINDFVQRIFDRASDVNNCPVQVLITTPPIPASWDVNKVVDKCFEYTIRKETVHNDPDVGSVLENWHPILFAANYCMTGMLEYLLGCDEISMEMKLDAMELYGTNLIFMKEKYGEGYMCWHTATEMRTAKSGILNQQLRLPFNEETPSTTDPAFLKVLVALALAFETFDKGTKFPKEIDTNKRKIFADALEFQTMEDLQLLNDQKIHLLFVYGALVGERLIGSTIKHNDKITYELGKLYVKIQKPIPFVLSAIQDFSWLVTNCRNDDCISDELRTNIVCVNKRLAESVVNEGIRNVLGFSTALSVLKCLFMICNRFINFEEKRSSTEIQEFFQMLLVTIISINKMEKSTEEYSEFMATLTKIVKFNLKGTLGLNLLHHVAISRKVRSTIWPDIQQNGEFASEAPVFWESQFCDLHVIIQLLLDCGADPNAVTYNGLTPLHALYILENTSRKLKSSHKAAVECLIAGGAHADLPGRKGITAIGLSTTSKVPISWGKLMNLQCIASTFIVKNKVPYKGQVSPYLEQYIQMHSFRGSKRKQKGLFG